VLITTPTKNKEKTKVTVTATDNVGVTKVKLFLDGKLIKTDKSAPYSFILKTKKLSDGTHTLVAKAYDKAGNEGVSQTLTLSLSNKQRKENYDHDSKSSSSAESEDDGEEIDD
jgi:hypothetical protein